MRELRLIQNMRKITKKHFKPSRASKNRKWTISGSCVRSSFAENPELGSTSSGRLPPCLSGARTRSATRSSIWAGLIFKTSIFQMTEPGPAAGGEDKSPGSSVKRSPPPQQSRLREIPSKLPEEQAPSSGSQAPIADGKIKRLTGSAKEDKKGRKKTKKEGKTSNKRIRKRDEKCDSELKIIDLIQKFRKRHMTRQEVWGTSW